MNRLKGRTRALATAVALTLGLWSGSAPAQAAPADVLVVSVLAYQSPTGWVEPNTGWADVSTLPNMVAIGSTYGAPKGLGRHALTLGSPGTGDTVAVIARAADPHAHDLRPAFSQTLRATADLSLGFWLYLPSAADAAPQISTGLFASDGMLAVIGFDPIANGYTTRDSWIYVDTTTAESEWSVGGRLGVPDTHMSWREIIADSDMGGLSFGTIGFSHHEGVLGAIDGVTAADNSTITVTDFEPTVSTARPPLDDCKNDGWRTHPAGPFNNQGACIAVIVAAN